MTDDVHAALRDLAGQVEAPALDLAALRRAAGRRRRSRRLSVAAAVAVVLVAAPLAWSAAPAARDEVVQQPRLAAPEARDDGHVSGTFGLSYDPARYDAEAAAAALPACDAVPGLRSTGLTMFSLPPQRSYWFAGTTAEQQTAQRCLEAMPAAVVAFTPDPAFVPVVLTRASLSGQGPLELATGPLRRSPEGWFEHDLVLTNRGPRPVTVDPFRFAEAVEASLLVMTDVCTYAEGDVDCGTADTRKTVGPGEAVTTTVRLYRDLAGLQALQPGDFTASWPLPVGGDAEGDRVRRLELTYEVLSTATPEGSQPRAPRLSPPPSAPSGPTQTVTVFFSRANDDSPYCNGVVPVARTVPATEGVARAALEQLFAGPTPEEERRYGARSAFSPRTADLLNSVRVEEGIAYVDLRDFTTVEGASTQLGAYSTSCGMGAFSGQVETTLRQFPTVREVRYAFDGDPRAFVEYMQGGCPDEPVPPGDVCDPAPFRR